MFERVTTAFLFNASMQAALSRGRYPPCFGSYVKLSPGFATCYITAIRGSKSMLDPSDSGTSGC